MYAIACLANIALMKNDFENAFKQVEIILNYLETGNNLDGADDPFLINLICFRVLNANQDIRAKPFLRSIVQQLQEQARKINDKELQSSFLGNVPSNREILKEVKTHGIAMEELGNADVT